MYVCGSHPGNDASQWTRDLCSKGVSLILSYLLFFSFLFYYFSCCSTFSGFWSKPTVDQPTVNQHTVDNGGGSVAVAVSVSDR